MTSGKIRRSGFGATEGGSIKNHYYNLSLLDVGRKGIDFSYKKICEGRHCQKLAGTTKHNYSYSGSIWWGNYQFSHYLWKFVISAVSYSVTFKPSVPSGSYSYYYGLIDAVISRLNALSTSTTFSRTSGIGIVAITIGTQA